MNNQAYPIATFETVRGLMAYTEALMMDPAWEVATEFGRFRFEKLDRKWTIFFVAPYWPQKVLKAFDHFSIGYIKARTR